MLDWNSDITPDLTDDNWQDELNPGGRSTDELLEVFADMKKMEAFGKKIGGYLKEIIRSRIPEGEDEYIGTNWSVQLNWRERAGGLDKNLLLEEYGEEWIAEHSKDPTEYVEMRLKHNE